VFRGVLHLTVECTVANIDIKVKYTILVIVQGFPPTPLNPNTNHNPTNKRLVHICSTREVKSMLGKACFSLLSLLEKSFEPITIGLYYDHSVRIQKGMWGAV